MENRRTIAGNTLQLMKPGRGETTPPLQLYQWPRNSSAEKGNGHNNGHDLSDASSDYSLPRPVEFAWAPVEGARGPLVYDFALSLDRDFDQAQTVTGLVETRIAADNLYIGTTYFWKVTAWDENGQAAGIGEGFFHTHPTPPRWIRVPGITNVRDIGGWELPGGKRVRQGMLYRGSEMNGHCQINDEGREVLIHDLGIRTDLDLRGIGEDRMAVLDHHWVEYINIPVMGYNLIASPEYTGRFREIFSLLADRTLYPFYLHCWGGADRTGTIAFLVQALLGMRDEDLYADYELTSLSIWGDRLRWSEAFQDLLDTLALFAPQGSSIQRQVERYCHVIGVSDEEIQSIREILTE